MGVCAAEPFVLVVGRRGRDLSLGFSSHIIIHCSFLREPLSGLLESQGVGCAMRALRLGSPNVNSAKGGGSPVPSSQINSCPRPPGQRLELSEGRAPQTPLLLSKASEGAETRRVPLSVKTTPGTPPSAGKASLSRPRPNRD